MDLWIKPSSQGNFYALLLAAAPAPVQQSYLAGSEGAGGAVSGAVVAAAVVVALLVLVSLLAATLLYHRPPGLRLGGLGTWLRDLAHSKSRDPASGGDGARGHEPLDQAMFQPGYR